MSEALVEFIRGGQFRTALGKGALGKLARGVRGSQTGIPIDSIERMFLSVNLVAAADYSVTATSWTELDSTNLKWTVRTGGSRPVRLYIQTFATIGAGNLSVSFNWDGVEVTNTSTVGLARLDARTEMLSGFWTIDSPTAGEHDLAVVARVSAGTGTIYGTLYVHAAAMEI